MFSAVLFVSLTLLTCRYCYECINKATGARHCLVCGDQEGTNLIHCTSCPRAYHTNCINPNMSKVRVARTEARQTFLLLINSLSAALSLNNSLLLKILCPNGVLKKVGCFCNNSLRSFT